MLSETPEKLINELEKQREECRIAANIGQMLLKENEKVCWVFTTVKSLHRGIRTKTARD
jgi:hypothetical protein